MPVPFESLGQIEQSWFEDDLWSLHSAALPKYLTRIEEPNLDLWSEEIANPPKPDQLSDRRGLFPRFLRLAQQHNLQ